MKLTPKTKISELLQVYPFLQDYLIELSPKFNLLKNPITRKTIGNIATLLQASTISGIDIDELIVRLGKKIEMKTGEHVETATAKEQAFEKIIDSEARHEVLKDIIRDLHAGVAFKSVKNRFARLIADIDASEISKMEQKLIEEGMPADEVKRLCDVHVQIFKEALEEKEIPVVPEGHPVHTFMLENRKSEELMDELERILDRLGNSPSLHNFKEQRTELYATLDELRKIDFHYLRKENQLFPILEGRGISGPSSVMWALHDDIRALLRKSRAELDAEYGESFITISRELIRTIRDMIYKEEHILYPVAVDTLTDDEWLNVKRGEDEIGYAWITPSHNWNPALSGAHGNPVMVNGQGRLALDTGCLTLDQVNLLLKNLPLDLSFVNENDEVTYYSATRERLFPRSPGVIGRKVQNCHPPKSVHVVQQILDDFKGNRRDNAEFWIQSHGMVIHIRYLAIRNAEGVYKGCLEITQDITKLQHLTGEKRLLD